MSSSSASAANFGVRLREVRWGVVLSLATILFGFSVGGALGIAEESLKGRLGGSAAASLDSAYGGDEAKAKAVVDKSWTYLKRAHLHGGAIGAVALGSTLLLASLRRLSRARAWVSGVLGGSGFAYAVFWLAAGFRAPALGSTGAAKESLAWLAIPSAGLLLVGLLAVAALAGWELFSAPPDE